MSKEEINSRMRSEKEGKTYQELQLRITTELQVHLITTQTL